MSNKQAPLAITDAVDFYRQWPTLRQRAERLIETKEVTDGDAELLHWMIKMVDMVGPQDIPQEG
ncbi:hypothetical protein [Marivita sp.]|jgi:hypothetical protein|uniref:hypothetical protein n=1 Tax=Marivita sp. TaxID=2003365 RepID=UPI003F6E7BB2